MLEVVKAILPMILACVFSATAGMFAAMAVKKEHDWKIGIIGAVVIEAVSFTIWLPCLNDLFNVLGMVADAKNIAFLIATGVILLGTAAVTIFEVRHKET